MFAFVANCNRCRRVVTRGNGSKWELQCTPCPQHLENQGFARSRPPANSAFTGQQRREPLAAVIFNYKFTSIASALKADRNKTHNRPRRVHRPSPTKMPGAWPGIFYPLRDKFSTHLDVGKFAHDIRRHIGTADFDAWRQALFLIPPAAPLRMSQETQVLSVRKDAHSDLPNQTARQKTPTLTSSTRFIVSSFWACGASRGHMIRRPSHMARNLI